METGLREEKEGAVEYFLIDFQNIQVPIVPPMNENQRVLIFMGENQPKVSSDLTISTQPQGKMVEWKKINVDGNNAIDFHIAFYIGRLCEESQKPSFNIISKDKGFDSLIKHLNSLGFRSDRLEGFPPGMLTASEDKGMQFEFSELFRNLEAKVWPRKFQKLKNYLEAQKNRYLKHHKRPAKWTVEEVIDKLISTKKIDIIDGKIVYPEWDRIAEETDAPITKSTPTRTESRQA